MAVFSTDSKAKALAAAPLFTGLAKRELRELARTAEDMDFPEGKVLCREGEWAREFFVIVEGDARVSKKGCKIATLSGGDFFGEIALLERVPRTATVTATTPLRALVLTNQSFWSLVGRHAGIERKILRALVERIRRTELDDPTLE
jgi:CRP/FNR family transcriptional regulator, cyclic AMP receptor protein